MGTTFSLARPLEIALERARREAHPLDLQRLARIAALITAAIGATGLAHWTSHATPRLADPARLDTRTGLSFVLSGVSLWLLARPHASPVPRRVARALAAAVVLAAFVARALGARGDTSGSTLAGFVLLGGALFALDPRPARAVAAQVLATLAAAVAAWVLLERAFGAQAAVLPARGAAAFLIAALGIFCATPREGATALVTSTHAGGAIARRLLFAALAIPALALAIQLGRRAELYDAPRALALLTLGAIAIGIAAGIGAARTAARIDRERERAAAERTRLASLVESADDAIIAATPEGTVVHWNAAAERMYGRLAADAIGRPLYDVIPAERRGEHARWLTRALRGEHVGSQDTVHLGANGERVPVSLALSPIVDAQGAVIGVSAIARDLGARLEMETALRRSEEQFRAVFEDASDAIFLADLKGRYTDVNAAGCALLGYRRDDLVGKTITDLIPAEDAARLRESRDALLPGGAQFSEWDMRARDGSLVPVEVSATILRDGRWQAFVRDMRARRAAEEAARDGASVGARGSRQRTWIEAAIEQIADPVLLADAQGAVVLRNDAARRLERRARSLSERALESDLRLDDGRLLPADQAPLARAIGERMVVAPIPLFVHTPEGRLAVSVSAAPVLDGKKVLGAVMVIERARDHRA